MSCWKILFQRPNNLKLRIMKMPNDGVWNKLSIRQYCFQFLYLFFYYTLGVSAVWYIFENWNAVNRDTFNFVLNNGFVSIHFYMVTNVFVCKLWKQCGHVSINTRKHGPVVDNKHVITHFHPLAGKIMAYFRSWPQWVGIHGSKEKNIGHIMIKTL